MFRQERRMDTVTTYPDFMKQHPWTRWAVAAIGACLFLFGIRLTVGAWWLLAVLGIQTVVGFTWYRLYSIHRDLWWGRKRGKTLQRDVLWAIGCVLIIIGTSLTWFMWMAFGEDVF